MPELREGDPVPAALAEASVIDATGARVRLDSFWRGDGDANGRACIVLLLRQFGCIGCDAQVSELSPRLPDLARAGVSVVLVGNGTPEQLAGFRDRHALEGAPVALVTDPDLVAYRALHLHASIWSTIGPRSMLEHLLLWGAGLRGRSIQGHATQQGGAMVVDVRGIVCLVRRNRSIGDHVAASDLVDVALRLAIETRAAAVV
jgi:peroxiredoxin